MIHDRKHTKTCLSPSNQILEANNLLHILDPMFWILSYPKSILVFPLDHSRHIRQLLQRCSLSDFTWSLTLKHKTLSLPWPPCVYICAYMLHRCICKCVIFVLFNVFHYLCPIRKWSLALYFGKQYCTEMLHCYLLPCTMFCNYLLWNRN